jgi:hypothetical protein
MCPSQKDCDQVDFKISMETWNQSNARVYLTKWMDAARLAYSKLAS